MIKYIAVGIIMILMLQYALRQEQKAIDTCLINHSKDTCWTQMAGG